MNSRSHWTTYDGRSTRQLRVVLLVAVLWQTGNAAAQQFEDHSLQRSAIKTWHVKCPNGRLGMVRYDTRIEPTRMCVSVQDDSRKQTCAEVPLAKALEQVNALGVSVCQKGK